jgi:hypothetical protein
MKLWDANNRYRVKSGELPTSKGVSYLEVKNQLLLNYCINLCFYMALKASGRRVKDHPVISQLLRIRILLEKLRPLDQKLRYQIDKLLKMATLGNTAACTLSLYHSVNLSLHLYSSKNNTLKSLSLSLCVCVCDEFWDVAAADSKLKYKANLRDFASPTDTNTETPSQDEIDGEHSSDLTLLHSSFLSPGCNCDNSR